jgi:hypothetical protein
VNVRLRPGSKATADATIGTHKTPPGRPSPEAQPTWQCRNALYRRLTIRYGSQSTYSKRIQKIPPHTHGESDKDGKQSLTHCANLSWVLQVAITNYTSWRGDLSLPPFVRAAQDEQLVTINDLVVIGQAVRVVGQLQLGSPVPTLPGRNEA